jgi:hypothetical protein
VLRLLGHQRVVLCLECLWQLERNLWLVEAAGAAAAAGLCTTAAAASTARVVNIGAGCIRKALIEGFNGAASRAAAVRRCVRRDLKSKASANNDGGAATVQLEARVLLEGVSLASSQAERIIADVLSEVTTRTWWGWWRGTWWRWAWWRWAWWRWAWWRRAWWRWAWWRWAWWRWAWRRWAWWRWAWWVRAAGDCRGAWAVSDEALISAILHTDVTILSPRRTPRVLDNPVRWRVREVKTDSKNTVIHLAGDAVCHDSADVRLPRGGINTNGDWAVGAHPGRHLGLALRQVLVTADGRTSCAGAGARWNNTIARDVWVAGFGGDIAVLAADQPAPCVVHETTVAAIICRIARNELLLRDSDERVACEEPLTFDASGGRERPAAAALTLILDTSNGSLRAPIDLAGSGLNLSFGEDTGNRLAVSSFCLVVLLGAVADLEVSRAHVRKLVHTKDGVWVAGLELFGLLHVLDEVAEALGLLGVRGVLALVLNLEVFEHRNVVLLRGGNGSHSEQCHEGNKQKVLHDLNKVQKLYLL